MRYAKLSLSWFDPLPARGKPWKTPKTHTSHEKEQFRALQSLHSRALEIIDLVKILRVILPGGDAHRYRGC